MLIIIPELCVLFMDNAPYHSTYISNYQKSNCRKTEVQDCLRKQNVYFSPLETLNELRERP